MADFCNICVHAFGDIEEPENMGEVILAHKFFTGGDIRINELFEEHMKGEVDRLISNESLSLNVGGICEHCGLVGLGMRKDESHNYLVAMCRKDDGVKNYDIAILNDGELEYQPEELIRYYEDD